MTLGAFGRKILNIWADAGKCTVERIRCNDEVSGVCKDVAVVECIKARRLERAGHTCAVDEWVKNAKENLRRKNIWQSTSREGKELMNRRSDQR
jgi:hypothetical protein